MDSMTVRAYDTEDALIDGILSENVSCALSNSAPFKGKFPGCVSVVVPVFAIAVSLKIRWQ